MSRDAVGHTQEELLNYLQAIRDGIMPTVQPDATSTLPTETIKLFVMKTIGVMTVAQEQRPEWLSIIVGELQNVQLRGADWQIEVEFFAAILAILGEQPPTLPPNHPYADAIAAIQEGIAYGATSEKQSTTISNLPNEFIQQVTINTVAVMTSTAAEHHSVWRNLVTDQLHNAQQRGSDWQCEAEFFTAILAMLDGQSPTLPSDHPYADAIAAVQEGIAKGQSGQTKEGGNPS